MPDETKAPTVAEIVANPQAYGFEWITDNVSKGDASWTVPLVRHLSEPLLVATFGERFFLDSANGTSRHVTNQRIARDMKDANATCKALEIQTAIVENMLGQKARRKTVVIQDHHYAADGNEYPTRELAIEASKAFYAAQQA